MTGDASTTLFHPFDAGLIDPPAAGEKALFVNAQPGFRLPAGFAPDLHLVQDSRPHFLALERDGHTVSPEPQGDGYAMVLVLAGRHRGSNELWVADALRRVGPGGRIVVAGAKTDGAASLRKRIADLAAVEDHASKHHGVVFWLRRPADPEAAAAVLEAANPPATVEGFTTAPGMFSFDRVDPASRLLAGHLPADLKGAGADFGAGWGYLSVCLSNRSPAIASIDLFEASHAACEAARKNMAALAPKVAAKVQWRDLLAEKLERRYDVIVMNPPFHQGRAAEPSIGERMIRAAPAALKPGGRLFLVANRPLPYEAVLQAAFARHGEIARDERFKVLWAVR